MNTVEIYIEILKRTYHFMEEAKLNVLTVDHGVAKGFSLRTIPYIGIYGNPYYLMPPLTVLKPTSTDIIRHMPSKLRSAISMFTRRYPKGDIDFLVINHNAIDVVPCEAMSSVRLNYVIHPYVFYNYHKIHEDKAYINMSLYKLSDIDPLYSTNESAEIVIDANNLFDKSCVREVHIHPSDKQGCICFSPNNAAFNLVFSQPVIAFFVCCVVTYNDYGKLMVSLHTLFSNYKAQIYNHFNPIVLGSNLKLLSKETKDLNNIYSNSLPALLETLIEHIKNVFALAASKLIGQHNMSNKYKAFKATLSIIGAKILCVNTEISKKERGLVESFVSSFYKGQWFNCIKTNYRETFIESYIKDLPLEYCAKLLKKYMDEVIDKYKNVFDLQRALLASEGEVKKSYTDEEILKEQKKVFPDCSFFTEIGEVVNPDIDILIQYISMLQTDKEKAMNGFWKLSVTVRNLIFYSTWLIKGQPKNVHDKFGECSFLEIKEIEKKYFLNDEERYKLLNNILLYLLTL